MCVVTASNAQQSKMWPKAWLEAEGGFGSLVIEYRLTNECDIDPDFEIVEHPNIEVTREEILGSLASFLKRATREDISEKAFTSASLEVFGQEDIPDRTLEKSEYEALLASLKRLGPWPQVRTMPLGSDTFRCTFDATGLLTKEEKSAGDEEGYTELKEDLSKQGPFRIRWEVEE